MIDSDVDLSFGFGVVVFGEGLSALPLDYLFGTLHKWTHSRAFYYLYQTCPRLSLPGYTIAHCQLLIPAMCTMPSMCLCRPLVLSEDRFDATWIFLRYETQSALLVTRKFSLLAYFLIFY